MAERDLLLVTSHFPPSAASGSFRLLGLARHLPKFGWRPIVVAPRTLPWEPVDEALLQQVPSEVTVIDAPYPQGLLARLGRKLFGAEDVWLPVGLGAARKAVRDFRPAAVLT